MLTLLKLLKDGKFHSGQALGEALGVSRTSVWKQLQQLESELDIDVHKVKGRGYRLESPISLLDAGEISAVAGRARAWPVVVYDSIGSTNAAAVKLIAENSQPPFVVLAERQTAGRGRRGRKWVSPFGENIYYSLALRIDGGMRQLEGLSLLIGLAVLKTLREMGVQGAGLKWPNDVLVGRRKIAGILLELVGDPADVCHVIIGIGINVNMRVTEEVDQLWTSLRLEVGSMANRNELAGKLTCNIEEYLSVHQVSGFEVFRSEWEASHLWQGRAVSLLAGSQAVDGVVLGIDSQGALRLKVGSDEKVFSGGELSLRLRDDT
ncbi:BirA, biotin- ligase [Pseudomonas savastanoi pv. glycinea]|uniref:bifunctional biotin--[acetyl-CoA-carboxylase] ligase/biotin operon repressor BirA n=1 Tax=Pseudomonas quasicaspiana TaxID=2829821 RepID=UPI000EFE0FAE|nr:bifunctional biotin--[acetyl-CoA-carboxylase] ligase/biotin operon repressor BirA [Pseudomonas quasicaspiana]MCD5972825.1 bifunctional biotin--[acetyl-CoA-carboxylase] ligase/biotin operon repressor BirA [Pseudomonas quasicaspiana]RMQ95483.1 BirA, biotin- ligase [Pseudomonas savastanoi pv. glycinea]